MRPLVAPTVRLGPEAVNDRQGFLEQVVALAKRRKRDTQLLVLLVVPSGAHPQLDPAGAHLVRGGDDLCQAPGDPEGDGRDERPEANSSRVAREPGERGPGIGRWAAGFVRERAVVV